MHLTPGSYEPDAVQLQPTRQLLLGVGAGNLVSRSSRGFGSGLFARAGFDLQNPTALRVRDAPKGNRVQILVASILVEGDVDVLDRLGGFDQEHRRLLQQVWKRRV